MKSALDWNTLDENLRAATIGSVDSLLSTASGENLYVICLQPADDGMGVTICANTEEGYTEKRRSEANFEEMSAQYEAYLRWAPAEWRYEAFGSENFTKVSRELTDAALSAPGQEFNAHLNRLVESTSQALTALRTTRESALAHVVLFVTVSDSDGARAVERQSALQLNSCNIAIELLGHLA